MGLSEYDPWDLARKAGGAQLLPENADFFVELVRCSALIAALQPPEASLFRMPHHEWREWINSPELMTNAPESGGDPHEGLFVAEIPCYGGGYMTIPSNSPEDPFIVECLLESALKGLRTESPAFAREIAEIALAGLWISNECLRRAGLGRQTAPATTENGDIRWPSDTLAQTLQSAVTFTVEDVERHLSEMGVNHRGIYALGLTLGQASSDYSGYLLNPVRRRPILIADDQLIVLSPMSLLSAIRDAILEKASSRGVERRLLDMYRTSVQRRIQNSADLLRWTNGGSTELDLDGTRVEESHFEFDSDKTAVVLALCDDLINGSRTLDDYHWDLRPAIERIQERFDHVNQSLFNSADAPREILNVTIVQGVGRSSILGLRDSGNECVTSVALSADELRVFALLNLGDALALWQVGRSHNDLPQSTRMLHGGFLDHYTLYRNRNHSYYLSDDALPDLLVFTASAIQSRLDAQTTLDPHFVRLPGESSYGTVIRLQSREDFPIYTAPPPTDTIELLVEGFPFAIWVCAAESENAPLNEWNELYFHLVDAIAFWLWQSTPSLSRILATSPAHVDQLVIRLSLTNPDEWMSDNACSDDFGITAHCDQNSNIDVSVGPSFAHHSSRADNLAERELLRVLLMQIANALQIAVETESIDYIVDEHAPIGVKRRFTILHGPTQATVRTDGLPRVRMVQSFDEQVLLDYLGSQLRVSENYEIGEVSSSERAAISKESVAILYRHFSSLVAELSGDGLLAWLCSRHESLIAHRRLLDITLATQLACFGHTDATLEDFQRDIIAADRASIASRFLLEFAVATLPNGPRAHSLSAYDRLIATASMITYYGQVSDSLHYGLSAHSFELLKSGRLALSAPEYEEAVSETFTSHYRRIVNTSIREFRDAMEVAAQAAPSQSDPDLRALEEATRSEFGLSLTELGSMCGAIVNSPFTAESGVGQCERDELLHYVASTWEYNDELVEVGFELLSLPTRTNFLNPDSPYTQADVYPWRFNRGLSYLRKPLLAHQGKVTWGCRALSQSLGYLCTLCTSGRVKNVCSEKMQQYQGRISNRIGHVFNDRVAETLLDSGRYIVRTRVKKVGGVRIARENGDDLGDIDVLAADPTRRCLIPIEAKCFSLAKTPAELANERNELFGDLQNSTGAVGRHLERSEWLRMHREDVLNDFRIDATQWESWSVKPIVVTDADLLSPRLVQSQLPVVTLTNLIDSLVRV